MVMHYNEARTLTHAGDYFTAMDDAGPHIRIEAPGGRVVALTQLTADEAQKQLEQIAGPFSTLAEAEQRIRAAFSAN